MAVTTFSERLFSPARKTSLVAGYGFCPASESCPDLAPRFGGKKKKEIQSQMYLWIILLTLQARGACNPQPAASAKVVTAKLCTVTPVNINWEKILTKDEYQLFRKLNTPKKIQDYLESLPINFEKRGETCLSPRLVIKKRKAHCIEGAMFAAAVLWFHGQKPLLLDLTTIDKDYDHVVSLFRQNNYWGAISKTNHAVLRYREPVYKTVRELAMSYFHEYFLKDGTKTMRGFSKPFDLSKYGANWVVSEKISWAIPDDLDASPHYKILTPSMIKNLRKADRVEIEAGEIIQWKS